MSHDIVIIGTGPAGVSAAFPLVEAGLRVLMVDAGDDDDAPKPPQGEYLSLRSQDDAQWNWLVGSDHHALKTSEATSPKLRVPNLAGTFQDFNRLNRILADGFTSVGSLASGGLSNAWGAGVARFDSTELATFPLAAGGLDDGYDTISRRIGISGASNDDLSDYFGLHHVSSECLPLDRNAELIFERYRRKRAAGTSLGVRIGRARLAVLTGDRDSRLGCNHSGLCLWGCHRGAIYSARYDLDRLKTNANLQHRTGVVVERISRGPDGLHIEAVERANGAPVSIQSKTVILAAGTIASTAIALRSLGHIDRPVRLLSNPTAAFILILPDQIGRAVVSGHNMAQLMASVEGVSEFGNIHCGLFSATYLPAHEFIPRLPFSRAVGIDMWRMLMPAAAVGNCFLPGAHSDHTITLRSDGETTIRGGAGDTLASTLRNLKQVVGTGFLKLGAFIPPGGFLPGSPGSDIHYAGALPMARDGGTGTTRPDGELVGLPGVYVADAACFPALPAKPHTLTMMANAHRIATGLRNRTA